MIKEIHEVEEVTQEDLETVEEVQRLFSELTNLLAEEGAHLDVGIAALALAMASPCHYAGISKEDALDTFSRNLSVVYNTNYLDGETLQ